MEKINELIGEFQREKESRNPLLAEARARSIDPLMHRDRRKTGREGSWSVTKIQELHQQIKRRIFLGMKNKDIASELSCSPELVSTVRNSPVIKNELAAMNAVADTAVIAIEKRVKDLAPKALELVEAAINTGYVGVDPVEPKLRLDQANKILDRELGKPLQMVDTRNTHVHFTAKDISEIKDRAMKNASVVNIKKEA